MSEAAKQLAKMLEKSKRTVFFGGAGVSTESGIPDFRSAHGLYGGAKGKSRTAQYITISSSTIIPFIQDFLIISLGLFTQLGNSVFIRAQIGIHRYHPIVISKYRSI